MRTGGRNGDESSEQKAGVICLSAFLVLLISKCWTDRVWIGRDHCTINSEIGWAMKIKAPGVALDQRNNEPGGNAYFMMKVSGLDN